LDGRRRPGGLSVHDRTQQILDPSKTGTGDRILFHAVHHARVFAAAVVTGDYGWRRTLSPPDDRWPWIYPCRVDTWVPLIDEGPKTAEVAPRKAIGRIQAGAPYAKLNADEYLAVVEALRAVPTCRNRGAETKSSGEQQA
jgi:hypothetical protein